jgi:hypothetical protein
VWTISSSRAGLQIFLGEHCVFEMFENMVRIEVLANTMQERVSDTQGLGWPAFELVVHTLVATL